MKNKNTPSIRNIVEAEVKPIHETRTHARKLLNCKYMYGLFMPMHGRQA